MKKDKNTSDLDDVLNKYLEGSLTEEEALALSLSLIHI